MAARREVWSALFRLGREGKVGDVRAVETILFLVVLGTVVAAFATWHAENSKQARVVQYELHGLTPAHYRTIAPLRHQVTAVIANIIETGMATGEFHVDNLDDVVMAISSLCVDVCRWFPSRKHKDAQKLGQVYAGVAERLVR